MSPFQLRMRLSCLPHVGNLIVWCIAPLPADLWRPTSNQNATLGDFVFEFECLSLSLPSLHATRPPRACQFGGAGAANHLIDAPNPFTVDHLLLLSFEERERGDDTKYSRRSGTGRRYSLRVTLGYSDTFASSRRCHCKRGNLYLFINI